MYFGVLNIILSFVYVLDFFLKPKESEYLIYCRKENCWSLLENTSTTSVSQYLTSVFLESIQVFSYVREENQNCLLLSPRTNKSRF